MELFYCLSSTTTLLIGFLTAIVFYIIYKYRINHYWKDKELPFDRSTPILGYHYEQFKGRPIHDIDEELYKKNGKIFGTYEGIKPVIFVAEPDLVKDIYVKHFHSFVNRRLFQTGNPLIDNMITALKDDEWKRMRSIISPTFTTGKLKGMMPMVEDCAIQSTENFIKSAESGGATECKRLFGNFTLDVIASVAFGTKLDSHNDPDNVFVTEVRNAFNRNISFKMIIALLLPGLLRKLGIELIQVNFFSDLIKDIIERRRKNKEVRNDFLQMLLEKLDSKESVDDIASNANLPTATTFKNIQPLKSDLNELDWSEEGETLQTTKEQIVYNKKELSLIELISQSILFFLAGYDTTATALTMMCYNLAHNHEAQKKIQMEVDEIWKKKTPIETLTANETRYIDAAIKESLRIYPPAVRLERLAGEDFLLGNTGFVIPKGMLVITPIYAMQRDPENFSDPEKFIPERFLPENISSVNPFNFLPFGSGPRNCVAMRLALMEIKVNLIHLLKKVEFDVCPETKSPLEFYNGSGLLQPKAVHLKVTKRAESL